ncbi:MAG: polysaccharide ABC transporter ATP-binding protein [Bdellovibrionales bacterium]
MSVMIEVKNLGKDYLKRSAMTANYMTLRDTITSLFTGKKDGKPVYKNEFSAIKDVSFDIEEGEVVGIIGRNGAGKSTLLKILSQITKPTRGEAILHGRVGSLLEVGTGFHPELSGRENIFMNGSILGMSQQEIKAKFDEIVEFAGVEEFIDMPVKRYSSGMRMRLAFSVAAFLEPEILVIDEVLSVGDSFFRKKCLRKMQDVSQQGRTILFVSHNLDAIRSLCTRAIFLEDGKVHTDSKDVAHVLKTYMGALFDAEATKWDNNTDEFDQYPIRPVSFYLTDEKGEVAQPIVSGDSTININIEYETDRKMNDIQIGYGLYKDDGTIMMFSSIRDHKDFNWENLKIGKNKISARVPIDELEDGQYKFQMFLAVPGEMSILTLQNSNVMLSLSIEGNAARGPVWANKVRPAWAPVQKWDVKNA